MRRRRLPIALLAASLSLAACAGFVRERIYQPDPVDAALAARPWPARAPHPVTATTADGLTLTGRYWPGAGRDVILYLPGNSGNAEAAARRAEPLAHGSAGLLVASYRGYPPNPGHPSEAGLRRDADAFAALARRLAPGAQLTLFGHSLGGAVALDLATRARPKLVVTSGTFDTLADMAPPIARGLLPDRWDNLSAIARSPAPVLLIHGTADDVVPYAHAPRLLAASAGRASLVTLTGGDHHPDLALIAPLVWQVMTDGIGASAR